MTARGVAAVGQGSHEDMASLKFYVKTKVLVAIFTRVLDLGEAGTPRNRY